MLLSSVYIIALFPFARPSPVQGGGFALSSDILLAQYDACIDFAIAVIRGDIERQISTKCQSEIRL